MGSESTAGAQVEIRDDLPDGMNVVLVEYRGRLKWYVRRGCTPEDLPNFEALQTHAARHGLIEAENACERRGADLPL